MTNTVTKHAATEKDLLALGGRLAPFLKPEAILFLYGPLGAGKTTLARGILRGFGFEGKVKSPTYTLVEPYELPNLKIFHFDLYRLQEARELEEIGIEDYFSESAISLIEWPENGASFLPQPDLACYISPAKQGRDIRLVAHSSRGEDILKRF